MRLSQRRFYGKPLHSLTTAIGALFLTLAPAKAGDFIRHGGAAKKPYAHHVYCQKRPSDCRDNRAAAPEPMSTARLKKLQAINVSVNRSIKPMSDMKAYGVEDVWVSGARAGDCEDYALAKRKKLIAAGFKPANLRFAMVRQRNGEAHLVLAVRTEKGDMVLDNLRNDVRMWNRTGYRYLKIQDGERPRNWVRTR